MNYSAIWRVIKKEFLALSRNRKVLVGIFAPLFLLPILFYGYQEISNITSRESEINVSSVYIRGDLPESVYNALSKDERIEILDESSSTADLILEYKFQGDSHSFVVLYDLGRNSGTRGRSRVVPILEDFKLEQQKALLANSGLDFVDIYPTEIVIEDLANEKEVAGYSMSNILPLIITLFALISVLTFAVELTTAEKETGTLETMFSIPIRKPELILAKLAACTIFGVLSMSLNLGVLFFFIPQVMDVSILSLNITLPTFAALFINIVPLVFIGAGLCIGVGMFANSYKESNAYLTPLMFVFMIPAYIGSTPGLELNVVYSVIPIINTTLLLKSVFVNQVNMGLFGLTFITNALFSVMSLTFMFKVFSAEKILFGSGKGFSFGTKRKDIEKKTFIEVEDVFLSLAVIVVLFIYGSVILPNHMGMFQNLAFTQYVFFAALPIAIIWYLKGSMKESLGLRVPAVKGVIGGVFIWASAFSLAMIYQLAIMPYLNFSPTLVDLESQLMAVSPFTRFFFIALTPGICEEILFRGFALRPLEKKIGPTWAIIITSVAFSVIHLDIVRLVPTFLLGAAFGYVTVKTRSIYPAIALHVLNNSLAIFLPEGITMTYGLLVPIFVVSIGIGLVLYRDKAGLSKQDLSVE